MNKLRSRAPYTCRRILPNTTKPCAAFLREQDRSQCEPCDEAEAWAYQRFMFAPVDAYARHIAPAVAQTLEIRRIWP